MSRLPKSAEPSEKKVPHIQVRNDAFDSPAYRSCNLLARAIYMELARRRGPTNNGFIHMSVRQAEEWCGTTSRNGVIAAIADLCRKGLIIQTHKADQQAPGLKKDANKFTRYMLTSHGYFAEGGKWIEPLGTYMAWDVDGGADFTDMAKRIKPPVQVAHESKDQEGFRAPGDKHVPPTKPKPVAKVVEEGFGETPASEPGKPIDTVVAKVVTSGKPIGEGRILTRALNAAGQCIGEAWCRPGEVPAIGVHDDVPF